MDNCFFEDRPSRAAALISQSVTLLTVNLGVNWSPPQPIEGQGRGGMGQSV